MFASLKTVTFAAMLAVGASFIGCASEDKKPVARRVSAVNSMDQMQADLSKADQQVQATQNTLHALAEQKQGDLRPSYDRFSSNVDRTVAMQDKVNARATDVSNTSGMYVNDWTGTAHEIRDSAMRDASLKRQEDARSQQQKLVDEINGIRGAYASYVQQIRDTRSFAANDLTPAGMDRLREQTGKSDDAAKSLHDKIVQINRRLGQVADSWRTMPMEKEMPVKQPSRADVPIEP